MTVVASLLCFYAMSSQRFRSIVGFHFDLYFKAYHNELPSFSAENIAICEAKRLSAGTGSQVRLTQWRSHGKRNVFVCSNRPCIIYSNRHKLVFSSVNVKEVSFMSPLKGSYYKDW